MRRSLLIALVVVPLAGCGAAAGTAAEKPPAAAPTTAASTGPTGTASVPPSAAASPSPLTGTQHAFVTAADPAKRTITFDLVEWFEGAQAKAACKEDGETETANDWCTGYYYRNKNPQLRTMPVKAGATLIVLTGDGPASGPGDLAKVKAAAAAHQSMWRLEIAGGEITRAEETWHP